LLNHLRSTFPTTWHAKTGLAPLDFVTISNLSRHNTSFQSQYSAVKSDYKHQNDITVWNINHSITISINLWEMGHEVHVLAIMLFGGNASPSFYLGQHLTIISGGARVFDARSKHLCCRPHPTVRSPTTDILMVTTMALVWTVNSTLSWRCNYDQISEFNFCPSKCRNLHSAAKADAPFAHPFCRHCQ